MRSVHSGHVQNRSLQALCVAVFLGLLVLPLVGQAYSIGTDVEMFEKRKPAPWPSAPQSSAEVDTWPQRFDAWLKDHFGFRNQLVLGYNVIRAKALGQSTSPYVARGRHDWLFYRGDNSIEQARGIARFAGGDVDRWIDIMEQRQNWLAQRGIPMLMVAIPNKERVYREYLPKWMTKVYAESHLDQINRRLVERKSPLIFMDLTSDLVSAKRDMKVYLKADTHWTIEAAVAVGYKKIMRWIQSIDQSVSIISDEEIERVSVIRDGYDLDLARMIGISSITKEDEGTYQFRRDSFFRSNQASSRGDVAVNVLSSTRASGPTVVWFRDSFTISMYPYLADTFKKIVVVEHKGLTFNKEIVTEHRPQIVVYQFVERFLNSPIPPE